MTNSDAGASGLHQSGEKNKGKQHSKQPKKTARKVRKYRKVK